MFDRTATNGIRSVAALLLLAGLAACNIEGQPATAYPDADRLVVARLPSTHGTPQTPWPVAIQQNAARWPSLSSLALSQTSTASLGGLSSPRQVSVAAVTTNYFATTGSHPLVGRTLFIADDFDDAPEAVVLSEAFWRQAFAADPGAVGTTVTLDDTVCAIVGVMPRGFELPRAVDLWRQLRRTARTEGEGELLGRLAPGSSLAAVQRETASFLSGIEFRPLADRSQLLYRATQRSWIFQPHLSRSTGAWNLAGLHCPRDAEGSQRDS